MMNPNEPLIPSDEADFEAWIRSAQAPAVADDGFTLQVMRALPAQAPAPEQRWQRRRERCTVWGGLVGGTIGLLAMVGSSSGLDDATRLAMTWQDHPASAFALLLTLVLPGAWLAWGVLQED